jgi:hypothetical protein
VSAEQFFAWVSEHDGRYELVDGEIVMLAPAARRHDRIVVNLVLVLVLLGLEAAGLWFTMCLARSSMSFVTLTSGISWKCLSSDRTSYG